MWADVKKRLPLLIKKRYYRKTKYGYARGDVAVQYVDNIRRYYDALVWLDENDAIADPSEEEQTIEEVNTSTETSEKPNDTTQPDSQEQQTLENN